MPKPTLVTGLPIQDWVQGLAGIPEEKFTSDNVQEYIRRHTIEQQSLKPYLFFSPQHYTRNLIFKNDVFECLAVCWDIGQQSAIHDHNDKTGWVYLAMGRLFIQNYRVEERDPVRRTCRLVPTDGVELSADQAGFVDKEEDVHKVCNLPRFSERAVSVHIYRQPMSGCQVYSLQSGTYEEAKLEYSSEFGCLCPGFATE
jgi:cysteine dioxygenase